MQVLTKDMILCRDSRVAQCGAGPRNTFLCMLISGLLGWSIGFALITMDVSGALLHWELMPLLPLMSVFGSSLLGMIVGGSGLFDKERFAFMPAPKGTIPQFHFNS